MTATSFGKYTLLERINVGGMAEVFKAKAFGVEGFERIVALKRILPAISADSEFVEMFINEAKIAVQLNHANIAQVFDLGKEKDSYFIAMEYINGIDLRVIFDMFKKHPEPRMPLDQACFIVMKICEGLEYAHNKCGQSGKPFELVHRDISPQNILVSADGNVKIIDFGIAKISGSADITEAGVLKGKFGYMSPEQVKGKRVDRRSDIFSTGVILYELCTGVRLFYSETDVQTLDKVRHAELIPPSIYSASINPELERIILKALAADPAARYSNAVDLLDDLQAFAFATGLSYSSSQLREWMQANVPDPIQQPSAEAVDHAGSRRSRSARSVRSGASSLSSPGGVDAATRIESSVSVRLRAKAMDSSVRRLSRMDSDLVAHPGDSSSHSWRSDQWESEDHETSIFEGPDPFGLAEIVNRSEAGSASRTEAKEDGSSTWRTTAAFNSIKSRVNKALSKKLLRYLIWAGAITAGLLILLYMFKPRSEIKVFGDGVVDVLIDGRLFAEQSLPRKYSRLAVGYHNIEVRKQGTTPWRAEISLESGQSVRVDPFFQPVQDSVLEIRTTPPGARIFLDNQLLERNSPVSISGLKLGKHTLRVEKTGYRLIEKSIDIVSDKKSSFQFELKSVEKAASQPLELSSAKAKPVKKSKKPSKVVKPVGDTLGKEQSDKKSTVSRRKNSKKGKGGYLLVNSTPWTRLIIDGKETGLTTPQKRIPLKAGKHTIRMVNAKYGIDKVYTVSVRSGKSAHLIKKFETQ